ncbi:MULTISPECIES: hypothetical protein [Paenibacillus]|uniref:hypothetical protein n=1 Tax=Paenibacillus TaxID=44249 RepID=UPI001587D73D|nr:MULTISPECIES: hypothetical protein [Paenibacillus]
MKKNRYRVALAPNENKHETHVILGRERIEPFWLQPADFAKVKAIPFVEVNPSL